VVEIGPGQGAITATLAARAGHLIAVELDRELAAQLREQFPPERVTVVEQDVLRFDFAAASAAAGERLAVVGNLLTALPRRFCSSWPPARQPWTAPC